MRGFFVNYYKFKLSIMFKVFTAAWLTSGFLISQSLVGSGTTKTNLFNFLIANYKTSSTLGYNQARDKMYSIIDLENDNTLKGIYTNYTITINPTQDPRPQTNALNMNCEHSWPQSMGAGSEPQKSDLHYLYPCRGNVNSSRGNKPFADINDSETDKWWRSDYYETTIPSQYIDEFSEVDNDNDKFEPREDVKGNIARSIFYFYTIYNNAANQSFFDQQKETLYAWHKEDPVDEKELERTYSIASYQNNIPNPFVIDSTLIKRIWFLNCYDNASSQLIIDNIINDNIFETNIDVNSDAKINIFDLFYIINREISGVAYFICN